MMKKFSTKSVLWQVTKKLSNLNLSIILLLSIACLSVLGTIIEQNQSLEYYQSKYPIVASNSSWEINWLIINKIGLDHVYDNWWFLLMLTLFFLSLITCTFSRQLPSLKYSRNWKFIRSTKKTLSKIDSETFQKQPVSNLIYSVSQSKYFIFHQGNKIYAHKGLAGRIAPIFVHISIIVTILGSLLGLVYGFTAQEMIPKGEFFHIKNIIKVGQGSNFPVKITGRIEDFYIDYNPDKSIQQFFSSISISNNLHKNAIRKQISVNKPLVFQGITFYQTNWEINGLRLNINNQYNVQQLVEKKSIRGRDVWISAIPINETNYIFFAIYNLEDKIIIYDAQGTLVNQVGINEVFYINKIPMNIKEIMTSTGIQIKTDPGIPIVYTGFFILMITTVISYISYSQLWIYTDNNYLRFIGSTNRNTISFEQDFIYIHKLYTKSTIQNIGAIMKTKNFV